MSRYEHCALGARGNRQNGNKLASWESVCLRQIFPSGQDSGGWLFADDRWPTPLWGRTSHERRRGCGQPQGSWGEESFSTPAMGGLRLGVSTPKGPATLNIALSVGTKGQEQLRSALRLPAIEAWSLATCGCCDPADQPAGIRLS